MAVPVGRGKKLSTYGRRCKGDVTANCFYCRHLANVTKAFLGDFHGNVCFGQARIAGSSALDFACEKFHKRVKLMAVEEPRGTSVAEYAGVGLQFAVAIIVFLYAGQWLDRKLGTSPLFLLLGVFGGAGAAFYSMYRKLTAGERGAAGGQSKKGDGTGGRTGPGA